jgi:hypothetical protein
MADCGMGGEENSKGHTSMSLLQEKRSEISVKNEASNPDEIVDYGDQDTLDEFPRSTTGVIKIMRSSGRPEVADLVEDLHRAKKRVAETTSRAEDLLRLLRSLHKKATGTFQKVSCAEPDKDGSK